MLGSAAIIHVVQGNLVTAAVMIGIAAICDFFDGFVARALKVKSEIGKELDSLADVVSFGVAPAVFLFTAIKNQTQPVIFYGFQDILAYSALLIAAFSGYRLAKFNLDQRQTNSFLGLPTPANAIFIIPVSLIATQSILIEQEIIFSLFSNLWFLLLIIPLSCWLLVSEIPLFALKFTHGAGFSANRIKYIFLLMCLLALILLGWAGLPLIIVLYVVTSLIFKQNF
ncbi:MAG: CDP-alcohol phosphatidyltransferase family protein [Lentimicrobium sp.]|nr:CDP-alcohol phosphatidyltransferase family protein [Lentimicrobium sp.]